MGKLSENELKLKKPSRRLYPKRLSAEVDSEILEIERIRDGKVPVLALDDKQKSVLLEWEDKLGEELEKIQELKTETESYCPKYFLTDEGKADFALLFPGESIPGDADEITMFFYRNRAKLPGIPEKLLDEVSARSIQYLNHHLQEQLLSAQAADGRIQLSEMTYLEKRSVMINPDNGREKLEKLQNLRKKLLSELKADVAQDDRLSLAKKEIAKMYKAKVNETIANFYPGLFTLQRLAERLGEENMTESEIYLYRNIRGPKSKVRTLHRLDKLVFGAGESVDDKGYYLTIDGEIREKLSAALGDQSDFAIEQEKAIRSRGLDPSKVLAAEITPEQRKAWGDRVLEAYSILSEEDSSTYVQKRKKPAADNKWQYVLRSDREKKAVHHTNKAVLDSTTRLNDVIVGLLVTCGHEIEGHVLQHLNREAVKLRLFEKLGGDRRALMSEGGAVYNESKLIEEIFGFQRPVSTSYLLAMEGKKKGGDFFECFMQVYGVVLSETRAKYDLSKPEEAELFKKEIEKKLKENISRVQKIFKGVSLSDRSGYLPETRDTVYLEQDILMKKLEAAGLTKLAFVGGLNLRNIATLMKLGLLKMDDIVEPKMVTKEIWKEIESKYRLQEEEPSSP